MEKEKNWLRERAREQYEGSRAAAAAAACSHNLSCVSPPQTLVLPLIELEGSTNEAAPARAIYLPAFIVIRNIDIYVGGSGLLA